MKRFLIESDCREESEIVCAKDALSELRKDRETFVFTDRNVYDLYRDTIRTCFPAAPVYAMEAGEAHKTPETLFALLGKMAEAGMKRTGRLVCFGGGVVGDIGGLASALYMRGVECVQIPTTLLAQVDSSVGGKTAVDFMGVKNLIGAFKQPSRVIVDPLFLKTLSARELRCGLGEIVKHAALDAALFDKLQQNRERLFDLGFLGETVPDNIAIKAEVVKRDARESGLRKCLNLGHTTGHAFELLDGKLSHGEYVLIGIVFEAELAKKRVACDAVYLEALQTLALSVLGKMPALPDARAAAEFANLDKKNASDGSVAVTAPVRKGEYALLEIPREEYAAELVAIKEGLC